ncbi:MAG: sodium:solute symporter family protein [Vicinamibacterales bacterium]
MNLHLALLVAYSLAMVAVGLWMSRAVRTSADFFVAGRTLSAPLLFSTVLAANIGAGTTIGAAGVGYRDGISAWWWSGSAAIGSLVLALFVGPRIWRIAKAHGLYTVGDYLELRYSGAVRGVITVLIWFGTLSILAGQLIGGAAILATVAGIPRETGIIASALVMTIYFVAGGLLSSAWVNMVQLVVLLGGFLLATPLVLGQVGGVAGAMSGPAVPETFDNFLYSAGGRSGWTFLFLLAPSFIISPGLLQKAYGASGPSAIRRGIGLQAIALALFALLPALLGMSARAAHPGIIDPSLVLPTVLIEQLPTMLSALALAAVFSAEVSTCDAILFMLSTSLSQDLYRRFLRPAATDAQLLRVARYAAIAGAIGGVLLAIRLPTVTAALGIFYSLLSVTLFVPIVGGLYTRRAGTPEAMAAIATGGLVALAAIFIPHRPAWWLDPAVAGLLAAALAFLAVMAGRGRSRSISVQ